MNRRRWLGTGLVEEFDLRQQALLNHVLTTVKHYYRNLHETRYCYRYPLGLAQLAKLCKRSGSRTLMAVRILTHSQDVDHEKQPPLTYDRIASERRAMHRPYRIFLRSSHTHRKGDTNEFRR